MSDLEIIDEVKASSSVYEGEDSSSVSEAKDPVPTSGHIEANPLHDGGDSDTNQGKHIILVHTKRSIYYRIYILQITQPSQCRYTLLQYRFAIISEAPST